jgi:hypothetical protein
VIGEGVGVDGCDVCNDVDGVPLATCLPTAAEGEGEGEGEGQ